MQEPERKKIGRFAPSPSGRMHLGNLAAAVASYDAVKSSDGKWILRIEDIDPQRSKIEWAKWIEDDLHWLGLDWDEGGLGNHGDNGPYVQSLRSDIYEAVLENLQDQGLIYPCWCTRADILACRAPHQNEGRVVYGGRCRPAPGKIIEKPSDRLPALRLIVPDKTVSFTDRNYGPQKFNLARDCGDFIVRRSDGAWAYQLAVAVDDALMGVTEVVRGEDLLDSTPLQIYIHELMGWTPPEYVHIPLLRNEAGQRLSKRDGSMSMEELRKRHTPEEILSYLRLQLVGGTTNTHGNFAR
ncbi:MAG: tRNA glutamyl-Q(34) synthetase GluQRS [Clostridium sp.]|nr:tRNA glutamyl-Q(34) synthetase GluQRS [Clostridium sp.]